MTPPRSIYVYAQTEKSCFGPKCQRLFRGRGSSSQGDQPAQVDDQPPRWNDPPRFLMVSTRLIVTVSRRAETSDLDASCGDQRNGSVGAQVVPNEYLAVWSPHKTDHRLSPLVRPHSYSRCTCPAVRKPVSSSPWTSPSPSASPPPSLPCFFSATAKTRPTAEMSIAKKTRRGRSHRIQGSGGSRSHDRSHESCLYHRQHHQPRPTKGCLHCL
jgi:hypothetical protein